MTKTPEELTEYWKAGKLPQWKFYYVSYSGSVEPLLLNGENDFINHSRIINSLVKRILAPVPTYGEYKAMQDQIADLSKKVEELKENVDDLGKDLAIQNENISKLHNLLKDIKLFFEECNPHDFTIVADNMDVYLTRIKKVLR